MTPELQNLEVVVSNISTRHMCHMFQNSPGKKQCPKLWMRYFQGVSKWQILRLNFFGCKFSVSFPPSQNGSTYRPYLSLGSKTHQNSTLPCWYLFISLLEGLGWYQVSNHQGSIHFWWPRHLRKSLGFWGQRRWGNEECHTLAAFRYQFFQHKLVDPYIGVTCIY